LRILRAVALMLVAASTVTHAADDIYIYAGRLLDQPGEAPRGPATIVVRDGKIAEVRDGHVGIADGARLIDLKDQFVLPGLIDMHVHLVIDDDQL
jgi:imidazolonepropionase-like amidohydrolase